MKPLTKPIIAADQASDRKNIESVLAAYEQALNASDADTVMTLYADDGVFMAQHSAPNVGREAIRRAYDGVFGAIDLDVRFIVDEVIQASPRWAFARTRSEGFVTVNATGDKAPEGNQEQLVFEIGAGLALLVGFQTRLFAVLLAGFSLVTAFIFHADFSDQMQQIMFLKNVAMAGGFLLLAKVGAPGLSADQFLATRNGARV
jgi:uncharacterized protein (TIGR02246 family)